MSREPQIVLIDDDADWAETLADYLRAKGFCVQISQEGTKALEFLQKHTIPLALVDWNMPDMDGLELLRRLRRINQEIFVFMISGDDEPSLPKRALDEGANRFLAKSTPPNLLLRAVREVLEASQQLAAKVVERRYLPVVRRQMWMLPWPRPFLLKP
jgi:DNA-binding response OmpR family regulator